MIFLQGIQGKERTTKGTDTAKTCQDKCKNRQNCQWHSYNKKLEVCAHFETCIGMNDQTDYVSSQSECSDSIHQLEDTEFDNPRLDNLYQCNVTGVCQVSYKPIAYYLHSKCSNILISLFSKVFLYKTISEI